MIYPAHIYQVTAILERYSEDTGDNEQKVIREIVITEALLFEQAVLNIIIKHRCIDGWYIAYPLTITQALS